MNARAVVSNLFALAAVVFASGCLEGQPCQDDACDDEEVGQASAALITVDFKKGCQNKGWIWNATNQTCKSPKTVCEAGGYFWYQEAGACLVWGSVAHKEAACERNGMMYVPTGSPNILIGNLNVHCEPKPAKNVLPPAPSGGGEGLELPCEVGLNCPTSSNPNHWDPYPNSTTWTPMKQCFNPYGCF